MKVKTLSVGIAVACLVIVLIFVLPLLLLGGSQMFENLFYSEQKESRLAEKHLMNKYGETFTVKKDTVLFKQTLGFSTMKAYPNDSPDTVFNIDVYHKKSKVYHENYVLNRSFGPILDSVLTTGLYYYDVDYEDANYYSEVYEIPYIKTSDWQNYLPDYRNEPLQFNVFTYWKVENKPNSENVEKLRNIESLIQLLNKNQIDEGTITLYFPLALTDEAQVKEYNNMIEMRENDKIRDTPLRRDKVDECSFSLEAFNENLTITDYVAAECSTLSEIVF
ncbi:hypothetical protein [Paenibacillus wynnii]|uniref:Uncharacterized protein n=1 Tax=Paenibacillus wynnii TaxID=268407 RepID=A0A098M8I7_9BACL|nr:hypothetical protein [Paenibacillus wynnii]KGE18864.1 hypothetical protein PWYN_05455 [Paenibacillus wynnii]